jgi:hypothetical protein
MFSEKVAYPPSCESPLKFSFRLAILKPIGMAEMKVLFAFVKGGTSSVVLMVGTNLNFYIFAVPNPTPPTCEGRLYIRVQCIKHATHGEKKI